MSYSLNSTKFLSNSQGSYQLVLEQACLVITSSTMTKTHSTTILNETIASLKSTTDHHNKDIQEIHKITNIHTRTLSEISQQLTTILQKLNAADSVEHSPENSHIPESRTCHQLISSLSRPVKFGFP